MKSKHLALIFLLSIHSAALFAQQKEPPNALKSLFDSFQYLQTIRLADQILEKDSGRADVLLIKGQALAASCRGREAIQVLGKALQYDSTNIHILGALVDNYRQAGEMDLAIRACRKMIRLDPENHFFRLQLSNLYLIAEEFRLALNSFLLLYREDTTDFYVVKQIANCSNELGIPDSAILFYQKAVALNPTDAGVTGKLTNLYIRLNDFTTPLVLTTMFLQTDSLSKGILRLNGYCYYLLKDYPSAILRFRKGLALGDQTKFTWKYLGLSYYKQNNYDSAAPCFREAFTKDTTDAEICFYYGVSAYRSGLIERGLTYLNKTIGLLLPSDQFLYTLYTEQAAAYSAYGEPDTALVILQKARKLLPAFNKLNFKIAYQYDYYLRNPWEALGYYKEFLSRNKENGEEMSDVPLQMSYAEYARNRVGEINRAKRSRK